MLGSLAKARPSVRRLPATLPGSASIVAGLVAVAAGVAMFSLGAALIVVGVLAVVIGAGYLRAAA